MVVVVVVVFAAQPTPLSFVVAALVAFVVVWYGTDSRTLSIWDQNDVNLIPRKFRSRWWKQDFWVLVSGFFVDTENLLIASQGRRTVSKQVREREYLNMAAQV